MSTAKSAITAVFDWLRGATKIQPADRPQGADVDQKWDEAVARREAQQRAEAAVVERVCREFRAHTDGKIDMATIDRDTADALFYIFGVHTRYEHGRTILTGVERVSATPSAADRPDPTALPLAASYDLTADVERDLGCRIFDCKDQDRIAAALEGWRKRLCMFPGDVVVGGRDIVSDRVIFHRLNPVVAEMIRVVQVQS